jgi:hypothetical protein
VFSAELDALVEIADLQTGIGRSFFQYFVKNDTPVTPLQYVALPESESL